MIRPTSSEISQAHAALAAAGYTWKQEDGGELREHLARHAPHSLTVGSKFSEQAWEKIDALHQLASDLAIVALAKALEEGRPLRVEITIPDPHAGTEGVASSLVCAGLSTLTRSKVLRDPGTIYQQQVEVVVLADDQDFPAARQFIAPAGVLWDSNEMGLYTLFPGSASRPFPRDEQALSDPAFHAGNVAFWKDHFFLATPNQVVHALEAAITASLETTDAATIQIHDQTQELQRVRSLVSSYEVAAHTRPRP